METAKVLINTTKIAKQEHSKSVDLLLLHGESSPDLDYFQNSTVTSLLNDTSVNVTTFS